MYVFTGLYELKLPNVCVHRPVCSKVAKRRINEHVLQNGETAAHMIEPRYFMEAKELLHISGVLPLEKVIFVPTRQVVWCDLEIVWRRSRKVPDPPGNRMKHKMILRQQITLWQNAQVWTRPKKRTDRARSRKLYAMY